MVLRALIVSFAFCAISGYGNMIEMTVAEGPIEPNFCNNSVLLEEAGLIRTTLGQFLGYECSEEFYHCRWQSDGFRTYRKKCKPGLVYDVLGTQNCNYDYNVKSCGVRSGAGPVQCNGTDFHCTLSEQCVPMSSRCDGHYDCGMEEDEQNCPLCTAGEFACKVSEQCIPLDRRCNGLVECDDGTDERDCDVCGHGLFHCGKSNECIPMDERCDGRRQCPHGEDEMLCKKPEIEKKFTCQSRDFEILSSQVCDGRPQCPDGSDEAYCERVQPPQIAPMSFSSNLEPKVVEQKKEEEEEDYEYEQIKEDDNEAAFPMLTLVTLPPKIVTTIATTPPPTIAPKIVKPTFSKPRVPSVLDPNLSAKTTQRHRIVHPNLVTVTSSPKAAPTRPQTRYPTRVANETVKLAPIVRTTTPAPTTTTEKVFIMQVTAAPPTPPPMVETPIGGQDILREITNQLNGGMSPQLLAKIEQMIKSEMKSKSEALRFRRRRPAN